MSTELSYGVRTVFPSNRMNKDLGDFIKTNRTPILIDTKKPAPELCVE